MRITTDQLPVFRQQALQYASKHDTCLVLDNHGALNASGLHSYELVVGAGVKASVTSAAGQAFASLREFVQPGRRAMGYLTYDLKNEIEKLSSSHPDGHQFPAMHFFEPEHFLAVDSNLGLEGDIGLAEIILAQPLPAGKKPGPVRMEQRVSREQYLKDVEQIREHIIDGDVYELNYCVEFYAEGVNIDPVDLYTRLSAYSPTPFGAFLKTGDHYLICASPERFMKKKGARLYSQPIKGTIGRGTDPIDDERLKQELLHSEKERAENLMIVDLVRNDLARSSQTGSVAVDELFGIYSFQHVHQMISTVSSVIRPDLHPVDAIRNAFPMGSMTGAPKIKAMELIEKYERTKRGLYSGAVGYFTPGGDFDLNVVIRSLQYNAATGYLSFEVGSAITFDSRPQDEYEECLLKARAMMNVLGHSM